MSKTIKIINDELVEIASYRNPEIVFHDSNNPRHLNHEYDNFERYCDFKEVINPFELYVENQQLKKQKDDVVEKAKEKIKRYESYIHDLKNGNYPSTTVRQERQELIFRIKEQKDLLRMLGEIDD